jgi:hypothetical protein
LGKEVYIYIRRTREQICLQDSASSSSLPTIPGNPNRNDLAQAYQQQHHQHYQYLSKHKSDTMAPSIEETVPATISQTAEHIQEKLAAVTLGNEEQKPVEVAAEAPAPAVQAEAAATPKSAYIREPLKLSGAIDAWKNFDVTPVIGREYESVDLAAVLKAENSDELLRDLAITSMFEAKDGMQ